MLAIVAFNVLPLRKEDGTASIPLLNQISGLRGTLRIDEANNKSGKPSVSKQYPILVSIADAYVYYNDPSILKGAYDAKRFYYELRAFDIGQFR